MFICDLCEVAHMRKLSAMNMCIDHAVIWVYRPGLAVGTFKQNSSIAAMLRVRDRH